VPLEPQDDLSRQHVDRLVLLIVVLQRQHVPRLDVQDLADVAVGARPDQLVAPGLGDAVGKVAHGNLELRIADCGLRNVQGRSWRSTLTLPIRNSQSPIRNRLMMWPGSAATKTVK